MIEMNVNGSNLTPMMGKQLRWQMFRKEIEPDEARGGAEATLHIVNSYELCDVVVGYTDKGAIPRAVPHTFVGIPFFRDEVVPRGEIWFVSKGEIVAKIRGLAALKI
jgi:hypothetical protein